MRHEHFINHCSEIILTRLTKYLLGHVQKKSTCIRQSLNDKIMFSSGDTAEREVFEETGVKSGNPSCPRSHYDFMVHVKNTL